MYKNLLTNILISITIGIRKCLSITIDIRKF